MDDAWNDGYRLGLARGRREAVDLVDAEVVSEIARLRDLGISEPRAPGLLGNWIGGLDAAARTIRERLCEPGVPGDTFTDPVAGEESDSLSKIPSTSPAAAARDFAHWVATQRAYNGSDHEHGQSLYNECINAVLPTWAEEWAAEQANPAPAETDGGGRLRDEEAEQILRAAGDPNLPDDVFDVIEEILAAHVRSAESSRARAMHSRAEWRRRAEEAEREYECDLNTANLAVEVAEQQRDFATAATADAVAKLDRLHDLLVKPAESRAALLAKGMIRDALAGKR
ncbi:hypothetical protein [Pimelobacter simplex]|uniref:hypothetical protein n=1 Tax=Nocardioides simplex TaxID=2045 RepID=UPI003AAE05E7